MRNNIRKVYASIISFSTKRWLIYPITVLLTLVISIILFSYCSLAPFGTGQYSLAAFDGNIQYLDFFSYLKDVINGENNISYSFSKGLGGGFIAVFSYYLTSPLNLLVFFFEEEDLNSFVDILVIIKILLAVLFMAIYIEKRFEHNIKRVYVILLSLAYGFMQYNIAQSSNIMWLDGVYMLPIILLGVYYCVKFQSSLILTISVGLSLIFNWYSALINAILTCLWFIVEMLASQVNGVKNTCRCVIRFVVSGVIGICLSCFILVPTFFELRGGRGSVNFNEMGDRFVGNPLSEITGFVYGSQSSWGAASLFVGSVAIIGFLGFLFEKNSFKSVKIGILSVLGLIILSFHFEPLFFAFSLFKGATSYWYRYSYLASFILIFCASKYFLHRKTHNILCATLIFYVLLCLVNLNSSVNSDTRVWLTVLIGGMTLLLIVLESGVVGKTNAVVSIFLLLVSVLDLGLNSVLLCQKYKIDTNPYVTYVSEQVSQIEDLKKNDNDIYRINQTLTRNENDNHLTANYNEGLAYGYYPLSVYTSDPDSTQRDLLQKMGYTKNGDNYNVVNTSILGADSILGVKYILSDYPIEGLSLVDEISEANGKNVYENPYALPLAFFAKADLKSNIINADNSFEYQNKLYSLLIGEEIEVYKPASFTTYVSDNIENIVIDAPSNMPLYGQLGPFYAPSSLNLSGKYVQGYSQWSSPSVFYVPRAEDGSAFVEVTMNDGTLSGMNERIFYYLDVNELSYAISELKYNLPEIVSWNNGDIVLKAKCDDNRSLVMSVLFDSSWDIVVDGKDVAAKSIDGSLTYIPLDKGDHTIHMSFKVKGKIMGFIITFAAFFIITAYVIVLFYRKHVYFQKNTRVSGRNDD